MAARKKQPAFTVNEQGYRVIGPAPVEAAKKALSRREAVEEIQEILSFGSGLTWQAKRRIAELLDVLKGDGDA
jgi:hypothetical protein